MSFFKKQIVSATSRIALAILLGLFILVAASLIMMLALGVSGPAPSKPWIGPFINHTTMLALSILLILALSRGKISTYGFKLSRNIQPKQILLLGFSLGVIGALVQSQIPDKSPAFMKNFTFPQIVIFIWIYASISEEILTRGLIQGYLAPLSKYRFTVFKSCISLPMLVSALFFALMHMALLTMGMANATVYVIVSFAFILGIIAGYYREKTESLIPAIIVHMLSNAGGYCTALFIELFKKT
jgi:membrane protease YdiL (CAAX protease family)